MGITALVGAYARGLFQGRNFVPIGGPFEFCISGAELGFRFGLWAKAAMGLRVFVTSCFSLTLSQNNFPKIT